LILFSSSRRRPWTPIGVLVDCVLIYFASGFVTSLLLMSVPSIFYYQFFGISSPDELAWARYVVAWTIWLITMFWMILVEAQTRGVLDEIVLLPPIQSLTRKLWGMTIALSAMIFALDWSAVYLFPEELAADNEIWYYLLSSDFKWLMLLNAIVVGPVVEEVAYRGLLFPTVAQSQIGLIGSAILTSSLWSLTHFYAWPMTVCIFVSGLIMCYLRHVSGSLWPSLIMHSVLNVSTCVTIIFYSAGSS
jgi:membrane protease YdiL (CAAX protease family)